MHPILFKIGTLTFYTHGILAVLGIIAGSVIIYSLARKKGLETGFLFDNIVFTVLFGIIGARVAYFILYHSQFKDGVSQILFLWDGGLVSYGGFIVGFFVFCLLIFYQKQQIKPWLDVASIGFFLALVVGRTGDIFAGEYAGMATESKWLSIIPGNSLILIPFFEAIFCLLIFLLSLLAFMKFYDKLRSGVIFFISVIIYTSLRFLVDFGRSENNLFWRISLGQTVSIVIMFTALIFLLQKRERSQYETGESRPKIL